jgi:hypothetical protein
VRLLVQLNRAVLNFKKMNIEDENNLEQKISDLLDKKIGSAGHSQLSGLGRILQGLILAGIIGLFVKFNELQEATSISKTEREAFKEDIKELKEEVRSLRNALYNSPGGNAYKRQQ